ncbi:hypothetical protein [Actinacidiphila sp. ITFR-21]|uniref:hypothetical protein n=1 Tax=Actinacidiphila sp. ITFR-21 TaxID=3075199 RepID=UPI00288AD183|nr:hypothetical protein [Streptomyces sp. ITFR-21]WNI16786.1 hypothetical protein RLT57_15525 [Streptomyces sp. ITFR-21]
MVSWPKAISRVEQLAVDDAEVGDVAQRDAGVPDSRASPAPATTPVLARGPRVTGMPVMSVMTTAR